ncbi:hypothetical protein MarSH_327 [Marseillevirus Shanghai 1]|nr:hypothetical protein MarSH_327 [Marseillevirus Shanghai 1]
MIADKEKCRTENAEFAQEKDGFVKGGFVVRFMSVENVPKNDHKSWLSFLDDLQDLGGQLLNLLDVVRLEMRVPNAKTADNFHLLSSKIFYSNKIF